MVKRRLTTVAMAAIVLAVATPSAHATHRPVYVPDYWCVALLQPTDDAETEACKVTFGPREHEVDISVLHGFSGSFAAEAAFSDSTVFWKISCEWSPGPLLIYELSCTGSGFGGPDGGLNGSYSESFLTFRQQGFSATLPAGGSVTVWTGPGTGLLLLTGRNVDHL